MLGMKGGKPVTKGIKKSVKIGKGGTPHTQGRPIERVPRKET